MIGRAENRALAAYLGEGLTHLALVDMSGFDAMALVDTQPGAGNNSFPDDRTADVVIDHHPLRTDGAPGRFVDVREEYGATATIAAEYLRAARIELTPPVATSLFYAIRTDTHALLREVSRADKEMYMDVFSKVDLDALSSIENATLSEDYYRSFVAALLETYLADGHCVSNLGSVETQDMVAELADFLLRLEGVRWVIATGVCRNELIVSIRTRDEGAHAERMIRKIVGPLGTAGGHGSMAGGQVPLDPVGEEGRDAALEEIRGRISLAFGLEKAEWRKLFAE